MNTRRRLWAVSVDTTLEAEDAVSELLSGLFSCYASSYFRLRKGHKPGWCLYSRRDRPECAPKNSGKG